MRITRNLLWGKNPTAEQNPAAEENAMEVTESTEQESVQALSVEAAEPMAVEITAITMVRHAPERSMEPYSFKIYATQPKKSFASGSAIGYSLLI